MAGGGPARCAARILGCMSEPPAPTPRFRPGSALSPLLEGVDLDFVPADPQPSWARWVLASVVALVGSLAADALLVATGEAVFPSTKDFVHFQFSDYGKLTVVGVVIACVGWPVVLPAAPAVPTPGRGGHRGAPPPGRGHLGAW